MRGEQEVAALLRSFGLPADRTVHNSGVYLRGDLTGVPGWHWQVKRQERPHLLQWIEQAEDERGDDAAVIAWRTSHMPWRADLELRDFARLLSIASLRITNGEVTR